MSAINTDSTTQLPIQARTPRMGSCWTDQQITELTQLLYVQENPPNEGDIPTVQVSKNPLNLAQLDADFDIYVPSVQVYGDNQPWLVATPAEISFTGWPATIDPTSKYCAVSIEAIYSASETGTLAKDPAGTGTVTIRPTREVTEISATRIKVKVYNAKFDVAIYVRLIQSPIPPQQA